MLLTQDAGLAPRNEIYCCLRRGVKINDFLKWHVLMVTFYTEKVSTKAIEM
jgi:hypothetical protein